MSRNRPTILALPAGVKFADILWEPTREEILTEWHLKELAKLRAELARDWLHEQTRRLAAVALEMEETDRRLHLIELQERQDLWWLEQSQQTDDVGAEMKRLQ